MICRGIIILMTVGNFARIFKRFICFAKLQEFSLKDPQW